ncbi:MAG: 1-deoxy-D-xylulose-5-phosphate synthase [Clostridiales bacterium]|nr:1-deoxy-D-xylulose-5-phosphate synthase [Clostridiales bacterium]
MKYLNKINSPEDLRKIDIKNLPVLAEEIREFLVENVSKTGGHLASNLGVTELTIALHYCLNTPYDKLVWDVGHQAYVHKILTGRKERFDSLRQLDGLCGFPLPDESKYDVFGAGHSSTSVSAAIGIAAARDLAHASYNVAAVIGDGSFTGGMVYEALNNAGKMKIKLLIVLNDNGMSIAKNVGSMSTYLTRLRTSKKYNDAKYEGKKAFSKVPVVGEAANSVLSASKKSLEKGMIPGQLFEGLGIMYVGPVDGNNVKELIRTINKVKNFNKPVLLHVVTKKGKGYPPAEKHPKKFHSVGKFDVETEELLKKKDFETYGDVFSKALIRLGAVKKEICAITAAMPDSTGISNFSRFYPERTFDVGIAEEHAVTFAAGLAANGYIPVFAVYSTFLQRSYDQLLHDVCLQNLHCIFAIDRAGIVGEDGKTHQGIFDTSFLSQMPNMTVMAPCNKRELIDMLNFAVKELDGPCAIRYPKGAVEDVLGGSTEEISLGKAQKVYSGEKIAIVSYGTMMQTVLDVYRELISAGINPAVYNARFAAPIDDSFVDELRDFKYIFTVEDNIKTGGYGQSLTEKLFEKDIFGKRIYNLAFPKKFIEAGTRPQLFERYGLDSVSVVNFIKEKVK